MCHNPNFDLESFERNMEEHLHKEFQTPTMGDALKVRPLLEELCDYTKLDNRILHTLLLKYNATKYKKNSFLIQCLDLLIEHHRFDAKHEEHVKNLLRIKRGKSHSGILSVTVFTSPYPSYMDENGNQKTQSFTCQFNCAFCPNEPGQPRSYLKFEPGVMRANKYGFDCAKQMWGRLTTLSNIGHNLRQAKLEIIVSGGTWTSYPHKYREEFIRDIYFAANTYHDKPQNRRLRKSLMEEKMENTTTQHCRVIGLTVEFRPDSVTKQELLRLRSYGCTRVQLGVQHLDDGILKKINRRCTTSKLIKTLKLLKDACYKIDLHIMPNLPTSNLQKDEWMMERFQGMRKPIEKHYDETNDIHWEHYYIADPDISADQWKLYPCEIVPYTEIEKWYKDGSYVPYEKEKLYTLLYQTKTRMYPWIRTNRIIRDIPKNYIIASSDEPNTGQLLLEDLKKKGDMCMCIRCRENKEKSWDGKYITVVRTYDASEAKEYFISAESQDKKTLYGFLRLRLTTTPAIDIFPELESCALIRELHVYSNMNPVGKEMTMTVQHRGIGKHLLKTAEHIAQEQGFPKIAVISGVGVQEYYKKQGYENVARERGDFMIRNIV
jgi:ELP3 family radical SAM enzyme/protein acetyltransferase